MAMTVIEKIGSRPVSVPGLFQPTTITVSLIVKYCGGEDPIPTEPNQVYFDVVEAGYVIEVGRPYGSPTTTGDPPVPGTLTPITGYSASRPECPADEGGQVLEGFEVTNYSVRRDTNSEGVFYLDITNQMVEYQQWNHAISARTPGSRLVRAWRVRPAVPTLAEDGTTGNTEDLVPQYAAGTLNGGDIGGQFIDINCQPTSIPIWNTTYTLSFVSRRPYYATAGATTLTQDTNYEYWSEGNGSLMTGKRLKTANGDLQPIGTSLRAVGLGITITPIAGTWVRIDLLVGQDEYDHLEQIPFSVKGFQPETTDRFPSSTGFKMTSADKVGFMDVNPQVAEIDMQYLPCRVLDLWQEQVGD